MTKRLNLRQALVWMALAFVFPFQNCAQSPEMTNDDLASSSSSSQQDGIPFAYKTNVDTLSYMSCSGITQPVSPTAYFTLRVLAHNSSGQSGLSLSSDFLNATQFYNTSDRGNVLMRSNLNSNTALSLSIRDPNDVRLTYEYDGDGFRTGQDVDSMLPPLATTPIASALVGQPLNTYRNYFPGTHSQRLMEGSLRLYKYRNLALQLRTDLQFDRLRLIMGFNDTSDITSPKLRGPSQYSGNSVYGVGFRLRFSMPNGMANGEERVISSAQGVQEIDMLTNQIGSGTWNCNYKFQIVRPEDANPFDANRVCSVTETDENQPDQNELRIARRVLRVEDWHVDTVNNCVVPRYTSDYCYGKPVANTTTQVQYVRNNGVAVSCSDDTYVGNVHKPCPHFVTVCIKQ